VAMLSGGVIAAPLAAYVTRFLPARALGVAVGGMLLATNIRELATSADVGSVRWAAYAAAAAACAYAAVRPRMLERTRRGTLTPAAAR
jgi:hypothetical protein